VCLPKSLKQSDLDTKASYRQILKATSVFGGVQVFQILINILRSKIIALWLGPAGMGIYGLYTSTITLVSNVSAMGLGVSAVKNIAAAFASGDPEKAGRVVKVLRVLVWVTGLAGSLFVFLFARRLSLFTFGVPDHHVGFMWISATLLFNQISSGQLALLRGARKVKHLASAGLSGSLVGLVVSVPLYYYRGIDGIVPAIVVTSVASLLRSWYFARKVEVSAATISRHDLKSEGTDMLRMGFMLGLSSILVSGSAYLLRVFIQSRGGADDVGLFTAGFMIVNSYVGMVFSAMGTDYYPRLSGCSANKGELERLVNQQAEMALLILAPLIVAFVLFGKYALVLLYSTEFVPVQQMVAFAAVGVLLRASSWTMGYLLLARGESWFFFFNELLSNSYFLGLNILGYSLAGFTGLGISYIAAYGLHFVQMQLFAAYRYKVFYRRRLFLLLLSALAFGSLALLLAKTPLLVMMAGGGVLLLVVGLFSLYFLNQMVDLRSLVVSRLKKHRKN
jgi:O-antigen/teichoic acid export membrane protein